MARKQVHLTVRGRVQGVFFRASTEAEATRLGVEGWVKNTRAGDVEILADGDATAVDALIAWARRGPPAARVDELVVDVVDPPDTTGARGFRVVG